MNWFAGTSRRAKPTPTQRLHMKPYYEDDHVRIYHADAREFIGPNTFEISTLVLDPPYDQPELYEWAAELPYQTELVFTDPRGIGDVTSLYGPPLWVFTWDTMSPWNISPGKPLTQTKFALWYGIESEYDRDAALWGDAPPERNHPTTKQVPLEGRRLADLWRESLRWLHHPEANTGAAATERFSTRQGHPAMRHAKPEGWLRCLLGNTGTGHVTDPFMGSGTTLRAAKDLGRQAIGIDVDERCCEFAAKRMAQEVLDLGL